jgi:exonuclease VII small subunit|tara:strand:- start:648 stop:878 length:231 start_codon:yes stop_codon:yes gene_type:complete
MKNKNIPADIKSKSIKQAKDEIDIILSKLEKNDIDLEASFADYQRMMQLNNHIDSLFKLRVKEISSLTKKAKKNKK